MRCKGDVNVSGYPSRQRARPYGFPRGRVAQTRRTVPDQSGLPTGPGGLHAYRIEAAGAMHGAFTSIRSTTGATCGQAGLGVGQEAVGHALRVA